MKFSLKQLKNLSTPGVAIVLAGLVGFACSDSEPRTYDIHRVETSPATRGEPAVPVEVPELAGEAPVAPAAATGIRYQVPAGWEEFPVTVPMRLANFRTGGEYEETALITLFRFPDNTGGLLANINRWRAELSLDPITEDQLGDSVSEMTVGSFPMTFVTIEGAEATTMGAIFTHQNSHWFVKMMGPSPVVKENLQLFIDFMASIRFPSE